MNLDVLCSEQRDYFLIFRIDTDKLGILPHQILSSEYLFENDLVRDAEMTEEHWITVPFTVPEEDQFIIKVTGWGEAPYDVIPFPIYELADKEFEGDYLCAYQSFYDAFVPCSTQITDLEYIGEEAKKGDEISLSYYDDDEKIMLMAYLNSSRFPVKVISETMDTIDVIITEDTNLRHLFLCHYDILHPSWAR